LKKEVGMPRANYVFQLANLAFDSELDEKPSFKNYAQELMDIAVEYDQKDISKKIFETFRDINFRNYGSNKS
jgi:hypothetical protein